MSNMSYCRWRNTLIDLQDCVDSLEVDENCNDTDKDLSIEERRAKKRLIELAYDLIDRVEEEGEVSC